MSVTSSIGPAGASHWTYVAAVLAERLDRIIATKNLSQDDIPPVARRDATRFFELVREGASDKISKEPSASINAYVIASDVLRMTARTSSDIERQLKDLSEFVQRLEQPRRLTTTDVRLAQKLRKFFLRLQEEGEAESYAESVHGKDQVYGFPLF